MTAARKAVTDGSFYPDRAEFARLAAQYPVVPVTRRVLADGETPIGVYRKLAGGPGTFLLESAEHGRSWSRYSFVGVRSRATLTERDGEALWLDDAAARCAADRQSARRAPCVRERAAGAAAAGDAAAHGRPRRLPRLRLRAPDRTAAEPGRRGPASARARHDARDRAGRPRPRRRLVPAGLQRLPGRQRIDR